jgi:hypothetical protein
LAEILYAELVPPKRDFLKSDGDQRNSQNSRQTQKRYFEIYFCVIYRYPQLFQLPGAATPAAAVNQPHCDSKHANRTAQPR